LEGNVLSLDETCGETRKAVLFGPELNLANRVAVVTGASRGFGREIALALARAGAGLVIAARDATAIELAAAALSEETGTEILPLSVDVTSIDDVRRLKEATERHFGAPEILINSAGVFGPLAPFSETDPDQWTRTLAVNTIGTYLICRAFVPGMLARNSGRIINLSSASSLRPPHVLDSAYSTSKVAVNRLTRHLAAELEGTGVAAMVIHPGSARTAMWSDIRAKASGLGLPGNVLSAWAERVEQSGGDSMEKAARLVLELVDPAKEGRNGQFCWIQDGLDPPTPSW
jgi:NAD(P)-dependent dehydrogenase (short-subunit alcohol dehydrogenase family)